MMHVSFWKTGQPCLGKVSAYLRCNREDPSRRREARSNSRTALPQVVFYQRSTDPTALRALEGSPEAASGSSSSDDPDVDFASASESSDDDADSFVGEDVAESLGDERAADVKRRPKSKFRAEHQDIAVLGFNAADRGRFLNVSDSLQTALLIFLRQPSLDNPLWSPSESGLNPVYSDRVTSFSICQSRHYCRKSVSILRCVRAGQTSCWGD